MTIPTNDMSLKARSSLLIGHCVGLIDMVALPLWVGLLATAFRFDAQLAGGVVTLFLLGVVMASAITAPLLPRIRTRALAPIGFAVTAAAMAACAQTRAPMALACLHLLGGLGTGAALSVVHGSMGQARDPHRLFSQAFVALGAFGMIFLITAGWVREHISEVGLFYMFSAAALLAMAATRLWLPGDEMRSSRPPQGRLPGSIWFGVLGMICMTMVQAMVFGFAERIGVEKGLGQAEIVMLLSTVGIVNIAAGALAGISGRCISARTALLAGPVAQGFFAFLVVLAASRIAYIAGLLLFVATLVFTHTFVFGVLSRLDPSGRATAATPAMAMLGSAIGPVLAGTLLKMGDLELLGTVAIAIDALALLSLSVLGAHARRHVKPLAMARQ